MNLVAQSSEAVGNVRPSPVEQAELVNRFRNDGLVEGESYFVFSSLWWQEWEDYVFDPERYPEPGEIDNSELIDSDSGTLPESDISEGSDYFVKCKAVWSFLVSIYGASHIISAKAVRGMKGELYVDLFPMRFSVSVVGIDSELSTDSCGLWTPKEKLLLVSRTEYVKNLARSALEHIGFSLDIKAEDLRVWVRECHSKEFSLVKEQVFENRLGDSFTGVGKWGLLLEFKDKRANIWPWSSRKAGLPVDGIQKDEVEGEKVVTLATRLRSASFVRHSPKVNQLIDAKRRSDGVWLEAVVVGIRENPDTNGSRLLVHFLTFPSEEDDLFDADDESHIQSAYTHVPDWREQLRTNEEVEVNKSAFTDSCSTLSDTWLVGTIKRLNRNHGGKPLNEMHVNESNLVYSSLESKVDDIDSVDNDVGDETISIKESASYGEQNKRRRNLCAENHEYIEEQGLNGKLAFRSRGVCLVEVKTSAWSSNRGKVWISLDSECIAQRYTHLRKPSATYGPTGVLGTPVQSGVVGLRNLGNTCFMNSMIQCISFTVSFTNFFISGEYESQLNRSNPLGTGGKLAEAYAALICEMWSDKFVVLSPTDFKQQLGRAFVQFSGYQQQDSHEFFSLVVDALHEDLNRVKKKPYTNAVEANGRSDREVAADAWSTHLRRNDSFVVDNMTGQMRSHLTCPNCGHEAKTFDPYVSWSVPISRNRNRIVNVVLLLRKSLKSAPILQRYLLCVSHGAPVQTYLSKISKLSGISIKRLVVAELHFNKLGRILYCPLEDSVEHSTGYHDISNLQNSRLLDGLDSDEDIFAWELHHDPKPVANSKGGDEMETDERKEMSDSSPEEVEERPRLWELYFPHPDSPYRCFRLPEWLILTNAISGSELYLQVWDRVKFMFRKESISEGVWDPVSEETEPEEAENDKVDVKPSGQNFPFTLHDSSLPRFSIANNTDIWTGNKNHTISVRFTSAAIKSMKERYRPLCCERIRMHGSSMDERDCSFGLGEVEKHPSVLEYLSLQNTNVDIYSCFNRFREREQLGENDEWFCSKCRELVRAYKVLDIWSAPKILVIHLKRFFYERNQYIRTWMDREKICDLVQFPLRGLNLSEHVKSYNGESGAEILYDCYAVSNHIGSGTGAGHYTSYVLSQQDGQWYLMDDSLTTPVDESAVVSKDAYVLFYQQRSP